MQMRSVGSSFDSNKIDCKHVDFLLCDAKTMKPIAGIELDDKSHQREDRKERDEFVEKVFQSARLPLVRFPAKFTYSTNELSAALKPHLNISVSPAPVNPAVPTAIPPTPTVKTTPPCPKCGSEIILRTAKSGANQGDPLWGCSKFSTCRGMVKYENV